MFFVCFCSNQFRIILNLPKHFGRRAKNRFFSTGLGQKSLTFLLLLKSTQNHLKRGKNNFGRNNRKHLFFSWIGPFHFKGGFRAKTFNYSNMHFLRFRDLFSKFWYISAFQPLLFVSNFYRNGNFFGRSVCTFQMILNWFEQKQTKNNF